MSVKKISVFIIILFVIFLLFIVPNMSFGRSYYSISYYIEKNGEGQFIDMYNPESYFDKDIKKEKLTELNKIEVVYCGNPKEWYAMNFEDIYRDIDLCVQINKLVSELDAQTDDGCELRQRENYDVYVSKDLYAQVVGCNNQYIISLKFERNNMSEEEMDECIKVGEEIIKDTFEINS